MYKTEYQTISTIGKKEVTGREIEYFYYHPNGLIDSVINIEDVQHTRTYQYFIYHNDQIIAYFPAKLPETQDVTQSDLIYFKTDEIKRLGFNAYQTKYLGGENSKKIIDDCYTAVNSKDIIIDGLNIRQYFSKHKKALPKYMVIEVSDNYFLFLKIY